MSYIDAHPSNWNWEPRVEAMVDYIQRLHPWQTYANTYWDHPPGYGKWPVGYYDRVSVDFWGGGYDQWGNYAGYRGKPLRPRLGKQIQAELFNAPFGPLIDWMIYRGAWWTRWGGWGPSPWGPPGSDAKHMHHIHVSYVQNT